MTKRPWYSRLRRLTEIKLEDLWREVKWDEEDWWGDVKQETLRTVKRLLESAMREELLEQLQPAYQSPR